MKLLRQSLLKRSGSWLTILILCLSLFPMEEAFGRGRGGGSGGRGGGASPRLNRSGGMQNRGNFSGGSRSGASTSRQSTRQVNQQTRQSNRQSTSRSNQQTRQANQGDRQSNRQSNQQNRQNERTERTNNRQQQQTERTNIRQDNITDRQNNRQNFVDNNWYGGGWYGSGYRVPPGWGLVGFGTGLAVGAAIASPPPYYDTFYVGSTFYMYSDGVYLQPIDDSYVVVAPPAGATVAYIPEGCEKIYQDDITFYDCSGVYYQPYFQNGSTVYRVVEF